MFPKTGRGCVPTTFMGATKDARACLADGIPENGVSIKTFSAHVAVVFRLVVSGKRFSTHGRVWGNRRENRVNRESRETEVAGKTGKFEKEQRQQKNVAMEAFWRER